MVWYTFKVKPYKAGNGSLGVTIPKFFINQGFLTAHNEYVFAIRIDNAVKVPGELDTTPHVPQPTVTTATQPTASLKENPFPSGQEGSDDVVEETYTTDDEYEG